MILLDVNVLVYAHRSDTSEHESIRPWLEQTLASQAPYGVTDLVLSGFLRIVTHPRIFKEPSPLSLAIEFAQSLRSRRGAVRIEPGARHWEIFRKLCEVTKATGNRVPDAFLAALAIESGSEWVTTDRGFARFPGLRWRHPSD